MENEKSLMRLVYEKTIEKLEIKYLGKEIKHIPYDKYFHMLANGMTKEEARRYTKAKLILIKEYHKI